MSNYGWSSQQNVYTGLNTIQDAEDWLKALSTGKRWRWNGTDQTLRAGWVTPMTIETRATRILNWIKVKTYTVIMFL